ncbi:uncharacterized protein [Acropora muricata]|uniref:uncharacterized protein isoform X2 n=1 Tax=Acropora muricata TaxID=159855 RepID=UPI0034E44DD0
MEQVSKHCVIALAVEVGKDWRTLGIVLELEDRVVEQIAQNYKTDVWEKAYRILRHWQEQNGSKAIYEVLDKALRHQAVGRVDLAEKYRPRDTRNTNDEGNLLEFKCGNISEYDLCGIVNELTVQDCMWVGRLLGLKDSLLDGIKEQYCNDMFGCRRSILREWIKRTGTTQATYGQLAQALLHQALNKLEIVQKYCVVRQEEQSASSVVQVPLPEENPGSILMDTDGGIGASSVEQVPLPEENPESTLMDTDGGIGVDPAVFISYNWGKGKENQKTVKHLFSKLTEAGFHCWLDIEQMGGGDNWNAEIDEGIRASKVVICCLTEEYCKSTSTLREATLADQLKKNIIPVLFESIKWPPQGPLGVILAEKLYIKCSPQMERLPMSNCNNCSIKSHRNLVWDNLNWLTSYAAISKLRD